jgi:hypothetical protein
MDVLGTGWLGRRAVRCRASGSPRLKMIISRGIQQRGFAYVAVAHYEHRPGTKKLENLTIGLRRFRMDERFDRWRWRANPRPNRPSP